jgi:hypothetical protein
MLHTILIIFFAINAIFWSLFTRETHCKFANMFLKECPSHDFYLTIGVLSFVIAFVIAQYDYLKKKM